MKRFILSCMIMFLFLNVVATPPEIDIVRSSFGVAANDKNVCAKMMEQLDGSEKSSLELAYLGGFQTIWANHIASPFEKLRTFKKGRRNIESAVLAAPDNVEIRFIRLSIQHKAPGILGYQSNIKEDAAFLRQHRGQIKSAVLSEYIDEVLKEVR